jgi:hypothetical protein
MRGSVVDAGLGLGALLDWIVLGFLDGNCLGLLLPSSERLKGQGEAHGGEPKGGLGGLWILWETVQEITQGGQVCEELGVGHRIQRLQEGRNFGRWFKNAWY